MTRLQMIRPRIASESDIIQRYLAPLAANYPGAFGLTDDAASVTPRPGHDLVVTMDAIASGVHFFADDSPAHIGWKALAVNISDLVAKGAMPHAYLMSLAFPEAPSSAWLEQFTAGLAAAQTSFGIQLIGGDTDRRPGPLSITINAFGVVPTGTMVRRGTARPGDHIFVSGALGDAALGLELRRSASNPYLTLGALDHAFLIDRYLRPAPRVRLVPALRSHASAAMDVSDGLMKDLARMAAASGAGARIDASRLPLSNAARAVLALDPSKLATIATGGDDYEVLAAVPQGEVAAFNTAAASAGVPVTDIGCFEDGNTVAIFDADGRPLSFARTGYDHF